MANPSNKSAQAVFIHKEATDIAAESHEGNVLAFIDIPRGSRN